MAQTQTEKDFNDSEGSATETYSETCTETFTTGTSFSQTEDIIDVPCSDPNGTDDTSNVIELTYTTQAAQTHSGVVERTFFNRVNTLISIWGIDAIKVGDNYTRFAVDELTKTEKYGMKQYRKLLDTVPVEILKDTEVAPPLKSISNSSAIVLSSEKAIAKADTKLAQASETLDGLKKNNDDAFQTQSTLAKRMAKMFAAKFKQDFAVEYTKEMTAAVNEVQSAMMVEE